MLDHTHDSNAINSQCIECNALWQKSNSDRKKADIKRLGKDGWIAKRRRESRERKRMIQYY